MPPELHPLISRWLVDMVFFSASAREHAQQTSAHVSKTTESVLQRAIVIANAVRIMTKYDVRGYGDNGVCWCLGSICIDNFSRLMGRQGSSSLIIM